MDCGHGPPVKPPGACTRPVQLSSWLVVLWLLVGPCGAFSLPFWHGMAAAVLDDRSPATVASYSQPESGPQLNVLVFGGNGFIGSATVEKLLSAGHRVVTVNRGNWYWDSGFKVKPFVQQVTCDRLYPMDKCTELVHLADSGAVFDVVVDFSAYHLNAVVETLKLLKDQIKLYIYVSTDSVYDVCDKQHNDPSQETDAVRPHSQEKQEELAGGESYGHRKLQIEEELARQREAGGVPYVSLRLPDVIGPKDNTYRWWIYQLWIKLSDHLDKTLAIPEYLVSTTMSLVYVHDVADVIIKLLHPRPEALDQAFNLGFKETPTLLQLLGAIKASLNMSDATIVTDSSTDAVHMFPSVRRGPVDITKAQRLLDFSPTPLQQVITETVLFYEKAMTNPYFTQPRNDVIRSVQAHLTSKPLKVLLGLKKHYGLDFQLPKEEL